MAIQVTSGETQVVTVAISQPTVVKSVTVGRPISSINLPGTTLAGLFDVNVDSSLRDGDILTWVLADAKWRNKPAGFFFDSAIGALTLRIEANESDIADLLAADSSFASQISIIQGNVSNLTADINALYAFDSDQLIINQIREDYDSDLSARLDSQRGEYIARDVNLQNQINNFEVVFSNADSDINARLDSQRLDYITRDSDLRRDLNNTIDQLDSNLQSQIDSNEVLLQSIRGNLQSQIDSNELFFRGADSDLGARIDSNYDLLQAIRGNLQFQIDSNEVYFRNVDSNLQSAIDSNYGVFVVARSLLQAQIDSNELFFRAQDSSLGARIDSDYVAFIAAVNSLSAVDSGLQDQIDSNETFFRAQVAALFASDSSLGVRIDSDYNLLQSIRTNLQSQIDSNEGLLRDFDSATNARIDSDYALIQSIRVNLQSQIDSNEGLLRDFDSATNARIDSDYDLLQLIRASLQGQIDSNETFLRNTRTLLISADSNLQDQIDSNEVLLKTNVTSLRAADISLQTQIDSNEGLLRDFDSATNSRIDVVSASLSAETTARIDGDSNLQTQIDSNYQRLISLTTSNIPEGSRLYYTDERVDDRVAALVVPGSGISVVYNDVAGTLTINSVGIDSAAIGALIDSALAPIQVQINSDGADIQQLFGITASLQSQINSDGVDIQGIYTTLGSLQSQINSDGSDIAALDVRVTALENDPGVDSAAIITLIDARIDSDDFVKLIGNQTISGIKSFTDTIRGDSATFGRSVGIGTTTPSTFNNFSTLTFKGNRGGNIEFLDSANTLVFDLFPYNDSGDLGITTYGARDLYLDAGGDLYLEGGDDIFFRTGAGGNRMILEDGGNLALGGSTTSVTGYTVFAINNNTNGGNIRLRNNNNTVGAIFNTADRMIMGTTITTAFTAIQSGNTTRMNFAGNDGRIAIGNGNTLADSNAVVEIVSTTRGILLPRMTTAQRDAITTPPTGLIVYDTTTNKLSRRNASAWDYLTVDSDLNAVRAGTVTGGGNDRAFLMFSNRITTDFTIDSNMNALTAGPVTVDSGVTITIPSGSVWTIV